jgi:ubiquinone/menaquinone biosynthesis C-methylase UbiE
LRLAVVILLAKDLGSSHEKTDNLDNVLPVTSLTDGSHLYRSKLFSFFFAKRLQVCLQMLDGLNTERALDLGCGSGYLTPFLSKFATEVVGVDIHDKLALTKQLIRHFTTRFTIIKADAQYLPFRDDTMGFIVCISVLDHVAVPEKAVKEMNRVSKDRVIVGGHVAGFRYFASSIVLILWTALKYCDFSHIKEEILAGHNVEFPRLLNVVKHYFEVEQLNITPFPVNYVTVKLQKIRQSLKR